MRDHLERILEVEPRVGAWAHFDPDHALAQARAADAQRTAGKPAGPLHGIPVGIKDVFDTAEFPTEYGTVIHAGRRPDRDAAAVAALRAAGAIIMGKTVTTELAIARAGKTVNPHDSRRTPGGSSSGSAAAVATGMVPLAIGSQSNGSIVRPASFCGVVGYKPSLGLIPNDGALRQSDLLDHGGVFARTIGDAALAVSVMSASLGDSSVTGSATDGERPRIGFVRTPVWHQGSETARQAIQTLAAHIGARELALPPMFDDAVDVHSIIMARDIAASFAEDYGTSAARMSQPLRDLIERGAGITDALYREAVVKRHAMRSALSDLLGDYDCVLTPAAIDEAPLGYNPTGSPIFCTLWTLCGAPAISLPLLKGSSGLPLGVQVVGAPMEDARLLRCARWLEREFLK